MILPLAFEKLSGPLLLTDRENQSLPVFEARPQRGWEQGDLKMKLELTGHMGVEG